MYTLSINMWFQKLIRQFFMSLDQVVFNFISTLYDLLISIARTSVLSQKDILEMADKIYKLLAVFMIFKVTLSLITYVVNPDDFSDKTKGITKLGTNIVISLGLLILTPYIFNYAYRFQTFILEDNSLANLIFDTKESSEDSSSFINKAGDKIAFMTMLPFFTPNTAIEELRQCISLVVDENNDGNTEINPLCFGLNENYEPKADRIDTMAELIDSEKSDLSEYSLQNYAAGINYQNLGLMFRQEIGVASTSDDIFIIDYKYIFSTVVGVIIILLLITFCMDVGLRSIKLAFLQLIAPIPILSYVDPKSGKDGMFKKWYQLCFKTYLSLFIRLLGLYFAIYIISRVGNMVDIIDGTTQTNFLIKIFIIVGALMFAKDLPKILEGLGIKLDGGGKFTLNPLKKLENEAMGGKNITGMARGALVGTAGALTGAGIGRTFTGAWRGMKSGKGWSETGKAEAEMNRKMRQAQLDGSTFSGRLGARFAGATGMISGSEIIARQKNKIETNQKRFDNDIKSIEDRIAPTKRKIAEHKKFTDAVGAMENRAKTEIENGNSWVGQEYFARKKTASYMSDNIGKTVTRTWTQRDVDYSVYSAKKAQKDMENAEKRIKFAKTEEERLSAQADYQEAYNKYEYETALAYQIQKKLDSGNIQEVVNVTADDAARAEAMASSWLTDEGMKAYMTDATSGTIDDATFRNSRATAEKAGETIGVKLATDGATIHSEYGKSKGAIGNLEREIYGDEQKIEEIKLEKAKLGDEMRDIEIRERKAKANESAIK